MRFNYIGDTTEFDLTDGSVAQVRIEYDDSMRAPWIENDGHGTIRQVRYSDYSRIPKEAGELVVWAERGVGELYDFAGAVKLAKKEWIGENAIIPEGETRASYAAKLARQDFEFCRAWANDEWMYGGVILKIVREDGFEKDNVASVWGLDIGSPFSTDSYTLEVALELIEESGYTIVQDHT